MRTASFSLSIGSKTWPTTEMELDMDAWVWIVVILAALVIIGAVALILRQQQTKRLRERFGPEYSRTVKEYGGEQRAAPILAAREKRVEALHIHPLSQADATRFTNAWRSVQAQFVDDPSGAITQADQLVNEAMRARGYPVGDFEQRAADVSVDHPQVVQNYRSAHDIALRHRRGEASTEDLRQAMVCYRDLFNELLETEQSTAQEPQPAEVRR
jgi:hypothetical protein